MSARDEFPRIDGVTNEDQWLDMCDEIDQLRAWKADATQVIERWERCSDAVERMGYPGPLGGYKSDHVLATIGQLHHSANRWAYKMTLLVGWVKNNCTPEQVAAARAASLADQQ